MERLTLYCGFAVAAWLLLIGLYGIVTSRHLVHLCLCLVIVQSSTYVLLTVVGYRPGASAPVFIGRTRPGDAAVDPVVQAIMLTDIVVEATVVALLLALTVRLHKATGSADPDRVNLMRG